MEICFSQRAWRTSEISFSVNFFSGESSDVFLTLHFELGSGSSQVSFVNSASAFNHSANWSSVKAPGLHAKGSSSQADGGTAKPTISFNPFWIWSKISNSFSFLSSNSSESTTADNFFCSLGGRGHFWGTVQTADPVITFLKHCVLLSHSTCKSAGSSLPAYVVQLYLSPRGFL